MFLDIPFDVIVEGPIDNGDGKPRNPNKRMRCTCSLHQGEAGLGMTIDKVTYADGQMPTDERELPSVDTILDAAKLAEWCETHEAVFTEGRTMNVPGWPADAPATD